MQILLGLLLLFSTMNLGASAPEQSHPIFLSYDESAKLALDGNTDLATLRAQEDALKLRSKLALAPNNPLLTYTANDTAGFNPGLQPAEQVYQLSFTLGFPGKALSQSANLRHQAEVAQEQAIAKEIDLLIGLSNNYVSFALNDTFYQLLKEEQKRDERLLKLLEKKFASSQAAKVDLLNAKVVSAQLQQQLLANRNEYEVLTTQFRQLIKKPEHNEFYPKIPSQIEVPELKRTFAELSQLMLKNRHSLLAAEHQVEATQSALTQASLSPFPDLQLMTSMNVWNISTSAPVPGVTRDYSFGIGISLPLFFPFNELTSIRAARQDFLSADYQAQSQRLSSVADLQTTYTGLKAAEKEVESLNKLVVPAAKASYDLTLLTYSLGKADYFRLNESRKAWFDAQKDLLSKKQTMAQLYNQFIQQVGCDFAKKEGPHACVE